MSTPGIGLGQTASVRVYVPASDALSRVQVFVQEGAAGGFTYFGTPVNRATLTPGVWNTISVTVPSGWVTPIDRLGVELTTDVARNGTVFIDAVDW